jgi:hypothetical protein
MSDLEERVERLEGSHIQLAMLVENLKMSYASIQEELRRLGISMAQVLEAITGTTNTGGLREKLRDIDRRVTVLETGAFFKRYADVLKPLLVEIVKVLVVLLLGYLGVRYLHVEIR